MLGVGTQIGGYVIEGVLGQGGMGVVYEAYQPSLQRNVALKLLAPELAADAAFKARFQREAVMQAAIDHAHIVPVYEVGESEAGLYLAMRLIRGPTLKDLITGGALPPERAVQLLTPIAGALDAAHAAGCIHRDVKPQNVLVARDWHPFLTDFGLTKAAGDPSLTQPGRFVGTAAYAAPEQISATATRKSDIYAFGAMLYECLTGQLPFPAPSAMEALSAHLHAPPPRVTELRGDLPPQLDEVLERALAKDPARRPQTARELVGATAAALRIAEPAPAPALHAPLAAAPAAETVLVAPPSRRAGGGRTPAAAAEDESTGDRDVLLSRVSQSYAAYLEQSLEETIRLDLVLEAAPEATSRPADRLLPVARRRTALRLGTTLLDVFDDAGGSGGDGLLVLGEPGAGKTTLLVELAAALAERAARDPAHPVPVYLPLSTWAVRRPPLGEWVVDQLDELYKIAPAVGRRSLARSRPRLVLLLDGLDELATHDDRVACAAELNRFAADYPLPIVVTSRRAEYESLGFRLELETAVRVRPLAPEAVLDQLREQDAGASGILSLVEQDPELLDLLRSPLLVNMVTLTYGGNDSERTPLHLPPGDRLHGLIDDYVDRRLELEQQMSGGGNAYPPERTRHWLATLAAGLAANQQTIFLLERIHCGLVPSPHATRIVRAAPKLAFGLGSALITFSVSGELGRRLGFHEIPSLQLVLWSMFGLAAAAVERLRLRTRVLCWAALGSASGTIYALLVGITEPAGILVQAAYYVFIFTLVGELFLRLVPADLEPAERLSWSWARARPYVVPGLLVGMVAGPAFGLLFGLSIEHQGAAVDSSSWFLLFGPAFGLLWALSRGVGRGLMARPQSARTVPNEGIRQSVRHGLLVGVTTLLVVEGIGLVGFLGWLLVDGEGDVGRTLAVVLLLTTGWGAGCGLMLGLASGGGAAIQHWTLRILLWRHGVAPLQYARWLAYCTRLRFLYWGVGGGHMFIHRLVQDHFAGAPSTSRDVDRSPVPG